MNKVKKAKTQDDECQSSKISESDQSSGKEEDYISGSDGSGHQTLERGSKTSRVKNRAKNLNRLATHARFRPISEKSNRLAKALNRYFKRSVPPPSSLYTPLFQTFLSLCKSLIMFRPGGGVHDLRMDGGLPPGFQKGTPFNYRNLLSYPHL